MNQVAFRNNLSIAWTMVIYLTLPDTVGLDSVSWKQTAAPPMGNGETICWDPNVFLAVIGSSRWSNGGIMYQSRQQLTAQPGSAWSIVFKGGVQQLEANGEAQLPTRIKIENQSNRLANAGLGVSGQPAIYQPDLLSGVSTLFETRSILYWVALFNTMKPGQLIARSTAKNIEPAIDPTQMIGPKPLDFSRGSSATVTAKQQSQSVVLDVSYGPIT